MIISPEATANRIAAVVTASSRRTPKAPCLSRIAGGAALTPPGTGLRRSEVRALLARIDVLEGADQLDAAVRLHLAEVHGERRMALLVHLDQAARSLEADLAKRLDHRL